MFLWLAVNMNNGPIFPTMVIGSQTFNSQDTAQLWTTSSSHLRTILLGKKAVNTSNLIPRIVDSMNKSLYLVSDCPHGRRTSIQTKRTKHLGTKKQYRSDLAYLSKLNWSSLFRIHTIKGDRCSQNNERGRRNSLCLPSTYRTITEAMLDTVNIIRARSIIALDLCKRLRYRHLWHNSWEELTTGRWCLKLHIRI